MLFLWGILAVVVVGAGAWWYGRTRAIMDIENRAITLRFSISDSIKEGNPDKAQVIIRKYTSGEIKIRDVLVTGNFEYK